MDCPSDVLAPACAYTVGNGNSCAYGQTYEQVYHKVYQSACRSHSADGDISAAASDNYKVGCIEQKLKYTREYDRYGIKNDLADQRSFAHIIGFAMHKNNS
jgi:hypothetical protein